MADIPHGDHVGFEQTALAKATRGRETDGHSVGRRRLERF
jgi:hypothetical protein